MRIVFLDFETFWSTTHSLSKMSPIEYVMHPDTEIISCAVKVGKEKSVVLFGEAEIKKYFNLIDWSDAFVIAHNNEGFDSMILAWRFGIKPKMWGCTLAMSRPKYSKTTVIMPNGRESQGCSLAKLVVEHGIGFKNGQVLLDTKGKHLKDFTKEELDRMKVYNTDDTDQCAALFYKLAKETSTRTLKLIDMTIRMLVEPQFEVDEQLLRDTLADERHRAIKALVEMAGILGVNSMEEVKKTLASSAKFSAFLKGRGVEVPMKKSPTNENKMTPALAKTDEAFIALQKHPDPVISAAARLRLDVKSTILESRIQAFLAASGAAKGMLPIPLKFSGADTTQRWSGWGYNPQNMTRVKRNKDGTIKPTPSNALRMSLRAPKGKKVAVSDSSGIELRVNHFLWKVPSSMALYKASPGKADLYKQFASDLYNVIPDEVTDDQRRIGKIAHLGLGFGAGAVTFQKVAKLMGGVDMYLKESQDVVNTWRERHPEIVAGWKKCHSSLEFMLDDYEYAIDPWGLCVATRGGIRTPQGFIHYPDLRQQYFTYTDPDTGEEYKKREWVYGKGRTQARIYAGKIDENIVQHLARETLADYLLEIKKRYPIALIVHDEIVLVVPEEEAEEALAFMESVMRTPPKWWPELVVWSEGDIADSYGEAK